MRICFSRTLTTALTTFLLLFLIAAPQFFAQSRPQQQAKPNGNDKKNKPADNNGDKKGESQAPADPNAIQDKEVLTIKTNLVSVDATVYNKKTGQIVPNLTKDNFAIFEDGVKKDVAYFGTPDAPITVTLVLEYSKLSEYLGRAAGGGFEPGQFETVRPAAVFLQQFLRPPGDYASVIAFDMRPTTITDFTNDPKRINDTVNLLVRNSPAFSENNVFDAVRFALVGGKGDSVVLENSKERSAQYGGMVDVQAKRRAIILISSGIDTFSRTNFDQVRKVIQTSGIPIYVVGTGNLFFKKYEPYLPAEDSISGKPGRLTFLQADNALKTFANESGGAYYPITFESEIGNAFRGISALLRNQYSLGYDAGDTTGDKKKHKIVVKVDVDKDGQYDDKVYVVKHRQFYIPNPDIKK